MLLCQDVSDNIVHVIYLCTYSLSSFNCSLQHTDLQIFTSLCIVCLFRLLSVDQSTCFPLTSRHYFASLPTPTDYKCGQFQCTDDVCFVPHCIVFSQQDDVIVFQSRYVVTRFHCHSQGQDELTSYQARSCMQICKSRSCNIQHSALCSQDALSYNNYSRGRYSHCHSHIYVDRMS